MVVSRRFTLSLVTDELLHATTADLVATGSDEGQIELAKALARYPRDGEKSRDARSALACAGEPAVHGSRHDNRASLPAV
jgi:hypothetical protein